MVPVYSPSSRDEFSFCPRKLWLRKVGKYVPRTVAYPELCAIGGNAVGKAMEWWNKDRIRGIDPIYTNYQGFAAIYVERSLMELGEQGRLISGMRETAFKDELPGLVTKAIEVMWKEDPLRKYAILAAEEEYAQGKGSRSDVRVMGPDHRQIIFDYKCKFGEVETKWIPSNLQQYANGEQRFTYTTLAGVDVFGIIMIVLKPTISKKLQPPMVVVERWPVTDWQKQMWLRDAQLMTPEMDRTLLMTDPKEVRGRSYPHGDHFGPCPYEKACMDYGLDEEKMKLDYIQIEKKEVAHVAK